MKEREREREFNSMTFGMSINFVDFSGKLFQEVSSSSLLFLSLSSFLSLYFFGRNSSYGKMQEEKKTCSVRKIFAGSQHLFKDQERKRGREMGESEKRDGRKCMHEDGAREPKPASVQNIRLTLSVRVSRFSSCSLSLFHPVILSILNEKVCMDKRRV